MKQEPHAAREHLLRQLRQEGIDERIVEAFAAVPREVFLPESLREQAYEDRALPIGEGQTISQPLMVALMIRALDPDADDVVLEIGAGSGYAAAVLSRIVKKVVTVERNPRLLEKAKQTLSHQDFNNVFAYEAGDQLGRPEDAPYDAILVSAGAPHVPRVLLDQLTPNGRLVIPIGSYRMQELVSATKTGHGLELTPHGPCAFVPLIGAEAWREAS